MYRFFKLSGLGVALALLALAAGNNGQVGLAQSCTVMVYPGESIQSAIDSVPAGAVICLAEGSWQENLIITKDDLILRGQGPTKTFVIGSILIKTAGQFTVENLTLQSSVVAPTGMVLIPAGEFRMGDSFNDYMFGLNDRPLHTVFVSAFYMDKYEVTKALWDKVASWARANGYDIKPEHGYGKAPSHPVYNVTWYEAVKWANARSEMEGLTPCYYTNSSHTTVYRTGEWDLSNDDVKWDANGYRLPTEAEWEKAARGGCEGHRFPWCDTDTIQHSRANYWSHATYSYDTSSTRDYHPDYAVGDLPYTSPVGSFAPNGYGLYDMAGNVWEWVWDLCDLNYYSQSPGTDPRGPEWSSSDDRVARGGDWYDNASWCRVASRWTFDPDPRSEFERTLNSPPYGSSCLGFRLVRRAP